MQRLLQVNGRGGGAGGSGEAVCPPGKLKWWEEGEKKGEAARRRLFTARRETVSPSLLPSSSFPPRPSHPPAALWTTYEGGCSSRESPSILPSPSSKTEMVCVLKHFPALKRDRLVRTLLLYLTRRYAEPSRFTVATLPKRIVLSHRTSSLSSSLPPRQAQALARLPPVLRLTLHAAHELLLGRASYWATYLACCPGTQSVPVAALWEENSEARLWVAGTELEQELQRTEYTFVCSPAFSHPLPRPDRFPPAENPSVVLLYHRSPCPLVVDIDAHHDT
jgi:hypothetical protein